MTDQFEHGYAVIIGVNDNQIPSLTLQAVTNDVKKLAEVLTHLERCAYKPENVKVLMGQNAAHKNIFNELYWLQDRVKEDSDATAVIYFSGHGMVDNRTGDFYLIPYDIGSRRSLRADAIKAESIIAEIADIQSERLLIILDCCHAGASGIKDVDTVLIGFSSYTPTALVPEHVFRSAGKSVIDSGGEKGLKILEQGNGRAVLSSSSGTQKSYIRNDQTMSIFTHHLIEALTGHARPQEGAREVLVSDVMGHMSRHVPQSADEMWSREQTPTFRLIGNNFPIALLLGGKGIKGLGLDAPPNPLKTLPQTPGATTIFNQENQTVHGHQVNIAGDATIDHIGDKINTGGGDYVRGNKTKKKTEFSGDFRGAIVNVDSHLQNVQQTINNIPHGQQAEREELLAAVEALKAELERAPDQMAQEAQLVVSRVDKLLAEIEDSDPDPVLVKSKGERLLQAAGRISNVVTDALQLARKIVGLVSEIVPFTL